MCHIVIICTATCQIFLASLPSRDKASYIKQPHPLGDLARMHLQRYGGSLHCRQRDSRLRRSRLASWSASRNTGFIPAYGLHVVIRQLEKGEARHVYQMDIDGLVEYFCDSFRDIPHYCRNLWRCCGIANSYRVEGGSSPWSCADNSNSV
jgi:hypothetical protein